MGVRRGRSRGRARNRQGVADAVVCQQKKRFALRWESHRNCEQWGIRERCRGGSRGEWNGGQSCRSRAQYLYVVAAVS